MTKSHKIWHTSVARFRTKSKASVFSITERALKRASVTEWKAARK